MNSSLKIALLILFLGFSAAIAEEEPEEKTLGEKILDKYWNIPEHLINYPTIELSYGLSVPSLLKADYSGDLALAYSLDLKYASSRYYPFKDIPGRYYYAAEYLTACNLSSHMKPRQIEPVGLTTDNWRFGAGYRNGYGYEFEGGSQLTLYHASGIIWSTVDFEGRNSLLDQNPVLKNYDETTRFGQFCEAGVIYSLSHIVHVNAAVENMAVNPRFLFGQWLVPAVGELIIQRTIDYFGDEILKSNPNSFPVINMAVKYAVSYILFNLRKSNMNWPFDSASPMTYTNFKIGMNLTF